MMELGRSARTLRATGSSVRKARPIRNSPKMGLAPCSLSAISGWRDGVFFIPWRGVPTIPARRSLTGSGRLLAASPVLFREIVVFFLANDGARAIGANAASYGVAVRQQPDLQRPEDGSAACSLSVISGWRDGVFFIPWRGVPTIPARRSLTGSGRRLAASPVLFREIAVFFLANDGARAIGANAASYGVAVRNSPIRNGPKMGLRRALSPSFPAGEMVCSLSLGGGCRRFRRGAV